MILSTTLRTSSISTSNPVSSRASRLAASAALCVRLWFLREIYEVNLERAARLWAVSRGAAAVLAGVALAVWTVSGAFGGADLPALRIGVLGVGP